MTAYFLPIILDAVFTQSFFFNSLFKASKHQETIGINLSKDMRWLDWSHVLSEIILMNLTIVWADLSGYTHRISGGYLIQARTDRFSLFRI